MFSVELMLPVLAVDELHGSKMVAALDRQHPRDLFRHPSDVQTPAGLSDSGVECFVTYLAGHTVPAHEVLFAKPKDISREFTTTFQGMTTEPVRLEDLLTDS